MMDAYSSNIQCYTCGGIASGIYGYAYKCNNCNNCKKYFCWSCSKIARTDKSNIYNVQLGECVHCTLDFEKLIVTSDDIVKYLIDRNEYDALSEKVKMSKYQNNLKGTGRLTKPAQNLNNME